MYDRLSQSLTQSLQRLQLDHVDIFSSMDEVRATIAELIGASRSEIAITTNTTEGTNVVATSLGLERGDNVVWDDLSFPSNSVVWLNLKSSKGVENRVAKNRAGAVSRPYIRH